MTRIPLRAVLIAATLTLLLAASAQAARQVVQVGNLFLADNGGIFPSQLPRDEMAPIDAKIHGEIGTLDGSHPPAVRTVVIDIDRTIAIDARGLPACRAGRLEASTTAAAKRACPEAILGGGSASVEVDFEEQAPFSASGPIVLFNGGVRGPTTTVLLHAYVNVPAPTSIVTRVEITRIRDGRFGMRVDARVPRIAGGAGSVTRFDLEVGRRFERGGRDASLLTARCPSGRWATRGNVSFEDGTELGLTHIVPCTPRD